MAVRVLAALHAAAAALHPPRPAAAAAAAVPERGGDQAADLPGPGRAARPALRRRHRRHRPIHLRQPAARPLSPARHRPG